MKKSSLGPLVAFVAFAMVPFTACDDTSSASNDETQTSSSSTSPGSSESAPESSVSSQGPIEWKDPSLPGTKCTSENDGSVEIGQWGNPKYGYSYTYYKCEQGGWKEVEPWVACDTAGVTVGDTCKKVSGKKGFFPYGSEEEIVEVAFIYAGNGVWEYANPSQDPKDTCSFPTRECTESDEFEIDSSLTSLKSSRTCYALCHDKTWETLDAYDVPVYAYCGAPKVAQNLQCCYTSPAEIAEHYPWNVSSLYEYSQEDGWRLSEYFEVPDCGAAAE